MPKTYGTFPHLAADTEQVELVLPEGTWTHPQTGEVFRWDVSWEEATALRAEGKLLACKVCDTGCMTYTTGYPEAQRRVRVLHQETCPVYLEAQQAPPPHPSEVCEHGGRSFACRESRS